MRWWTANPVWTHQTFAKKYNDDWAEWLLDNPAASTKSVLDHGKLMLNKYAITD